MARVGREEKKRERRNVSGYVVGELTSIAKGLIFIPAADTALF